MLVLLATSIAGTSQSNPATVLTILICGFRFDSSEGRGDFLTKIGVGRVIQGVFHPRSMCVPRLTTTLGWDEGVPSMSLGEKAVLTIPGWVTRLVHQTPIHHFGERRSSFSGGSPSTQC